MQPDRYGSIPATQSREIDQGLRMHLNSIYARMTMGVLITAVVAFGMSTSQQLMQLIFGTPLKYAVLFGPLAVVMFGFNPNRMSANAMRLSFIGLSVLYGMSFAAIFHIFNLVDVAKAFFISAGAFAGLSLYGYTTKKSLDGLGTFAIMGVIGAFILSIISLFWSSPMFSNIIAVVTLLAFAGMTAFQTQQMKEMYHPATSAESNSRMGWMAALNLYISFIAMFQTIMSFMGSRE